MLGNSINQTYQYSNFFTAMYIGMPTRQPSGIKEISEVLLRRPSSEFLQVLQILPFYSELITYRGEGVGVGVGGGRWGCPPIINPKGFTGMCTYVL